MRILLVVLLIALVSCSNEKKEDGATSNSQPQTAEALKPDGVNIEPQTEADTLKGSLKAYTKSQVGNTSLLVNYYSPATRGRMIWGGLVAYDNVWVTGAHKATNIEFDHNIKIGDTDIAAGKYALFTIPSAGQWTVIINKNWNQHLADDYNQAEDLVRLKVTPEVNQTHQERLRYVIESQSDTAGQVSVYWDKLKISLPFTLTP